MPPATPLAGARRRALTQRLARIAAGRLSAMLDPTPGRAALDPEGTLDAD